MAMAVRSALDDEGVLVAEAGTGTGKSFAYLIPAIAWARATGERVIVSTATIPLQEQLLRKDLPLLREHLDVPFSAVLMKGRRNYVCLRKVREYRRSPSLFPEDGIEGELRAIEEWSRSTSDGSRTDVEFAPSDRAWESMTADGDECLKRRCPEIDDCFFYRARESARHADILVVNHHLLLADAALRVEIEGEADRGILPGANRLVLDEAHHLEDIATSAFHDVVSAARFERILRRLDDPRTSGRGALPTLRDRLRQLGATEERLADDLGVEILPAVARARRAAAAAWQAIAAGARRLANESRSPFPLRLLTDAESLPAWDGFAQGVEELGIAADELAEKLEALDERIPDDEPFLYPAAVVRSGARRLRAIAAECRILLSGDPSVCRWIDEERSRGQVVLAFAPVEVGPVLRDTLYPHYAGIVLTSATLSVGDRFDHFTARVGLDTPSGRPAECRTFPSPFSYPDQALLGIPDDVPPPDRPGYEERASEALVRLAVASGGGAFFLFTSYAALGRFFDLTAPRLEQHGLEVLRQGSRPRSKLLERFRAEGSAVLYATDSFWEGVDVPGDALRAIAIPRLPFRVPTDPIQRSRAERVAEEGGDPFLELSLPQAVLRLRQGFGRLIRSHTDRGVVLVLDSRIAKRGYGHVFLDSLPSAHRVLGPAENVLRAIENFYDEPR